ncbi:MAG: carboxypeptidase-like regulatory domain-containing protein [Myxococcota bacterium]
MTQRIGWLALVALVSACGGGTMTGTVTVQGGSPANIAVFIYGPVSTAAVTNAEGRFSASGLPDGDYSLVAKLRGADVEEVAAAVKMIGGRPETEPTLAFTLSTGSVTGTVVFADGSDASNVSVTLSGAASRGTRTGPGGAFTFEKVPGGAYVVSVDLVDSREKRASVGVAVTGGSQDVGQLRLTLVGRIGGTVTLNGAPAGGVQVAVAGTPLLAVTDALGRFDFPEVPTGDATFVATSGAQQQYSATASTRVVRGANPDLSLALGDNQSRRGTVNGTVTFTNPQSPTIITVSVAGAAVTATPAANGTFTMMVPEGAWDIVASAPFHPKKTLGRVQVVAGQTAVLPATELSWYREVFRTESQLVSIASVTPSSTTPWVTFRTTEALGAQRTFLFNTRTWDLRMLANTAIGSPRFSKNAKYLGFLLAGELFLYEISTGTMTTWGTGAGSFDFSSDEAVLFVVRGGALERITLATGNTTRFPGTGTATGISQHTLDRWLVREASNDVMLVEPTMETAQLFTQVQVLSVYPTPWALTACGTSCTLKVVAPTGRTANTVSLAVPGVSVLSSPGDYPSFVHGGTGQYFIVKASDGSHTLLPTGTNRLQFSPDNTRYAFHTVVSGSTTIREERLPPTPNPLVIAQSTLGFIAAYVSNARYVAIEFGGPRRIFDYKTTGSAPTPDSDVDATVPAVLSPPLVLWPKQSAGKWRAFIGDKATLAIDEPTTRTPGPIGVRSLAGAEAPTDYAGVSFDTTSTWILDEKLGEVRTLPGGYCYAGERSGTTEFCLWQRPGAMDFVAFGPEVAQGQQDPGAISTVSVLAGGERGSFAITADRQRLWFGVVRP